MGGSRLSFIKIQRANKELATRPVFCAVFMYHVNINIAMHATTGFNPGFTFIRVCIWIRKSEVLDIRAGIVLFVVVISVQT